MPESRTDVLRDYAVDNQQRGYTTIGVITKDVVNLARERDEARNQVQTLRAALDTIADIAAFEFGHERALRKTYLVARKALAALEREESEQ